MAPFASKMNWKTFGLQWQSNQLTNNNRIQAIKQNTNFQWQVPGLITALAAANSSSCPSSEPTKKLRPKVNRQKRKDGKKTFRESEILRDFKVNYQENLLLHWLLYAFGVYKPYDQRVFWLEDGLSCCTKIFLENMSFQSDMQQC
jgi:hypothetical protein